MAQKKQARSAMRGWGWIALAAVLVAAVWGGDRLFKPAPGEGRSFSVLGGETRPLLDPMQFRSRDAMVAYIQAHKQPEVMDQVFCYCGCDQPPHNHKSLLSCFTDTHGAS